MPPLKNMYDIAIIVIHFRNSDKFAGTFAVKRDTSTQRFAIQQHPIDCTQAWIQFRRKRFVALVVCHLLVMAPKHIKTDHLQGSCHQGCNLGFWDSMELGICVQDSNPVAKMDLPNFTNQILSPEILPTLIVKAGITTRNVRVLTFEGVKNSSNWVISIFELWLLRRSDSLYKIAFLVPSNATETTFGKFSLKSAILQEIQE